MNPPAKRPPRRRDDRIILQFDYDCFYAQVFENKNPALKAQPLGVRQKNILATCNYNARKLGVKKLMLASEAKRLCPELILVDGEDLTAFRDMSKILYNFIRSHSWNHKVERLGFDEIFMDVTDIVEYNLLCLNRRRMAESFFHLSKTDPMNGFPCDLTMLAGCTAGVVPTEGRQNSPEYLRLLLGSHLGNYLRLKIEEDFGYTSTCGISTNKVLSKLVGSKNKPRNQTTLLAFEDEDFVAFMDDHKLRQIPGIGFKAAHLLESYCTGREVMGDSHSSELDMTAQKARCHPDISPGSLEVILAGPGWERGIGVRIWSLLHGVDAAEVKEAADIPSQISIEDTYKGLDSFAQITQELFKLSSSLIKRMRVDLVVPDTLSDEVDAQKWIAKPRTLRLSIRSWPKSGDNQGLNYNRVSRSGPLSAFIFDLKPGIGQIADRLVSESLLPLLRRLQNGKSHKWNLQLINICVANMAIGAAEDKAGVGRDIGHMFKRQDEVLRPFRTTSPDGDEGTIEDGKEVHAALFEESGASQWEADETAICPKCGTVILAFAVAAHSRYHELEGEELPQPASCGDGNFSSQHAGEHRRLHR